MSNRERIEEKKMPSILPGILIGTCFEINKENKLLKISGGQKPTKITNRGHNTHEFSLLAAQKGM